MVRCGVASVCVSKVTDFTTLGERWRELEQQSDCSFFQSWTWVGWLAAERFSDAVLVEAVEAGRTVALGLFNRVRHQVGPPTLFLAENGTAEFDCPYVEQNGILTETGREADLAALCLSSLAATHDVVLSGVGASVFAAARLAACLVLTRRGQVSPFIDLAAVRCAGGDYLAGRSANTRQQIRRSDRFYERGGPIGLKRACPGNAGSNGRVASGGLGRARQARKLLNAVFPPVPLRTDRIGRPSRRDCIARYIMWRNDHRLAV